jgi:diguanylate cyclase (GGDEF)-like protein
MAGRAPLGAQGGATGRGPLDPRAILTSLGGVVYDWDIASDRIDWGVNAADVLGTADPSIPSSGRELTQATEPGSGVSRHDAIFSSGLRDQGSGVPYQARYTVRLNAGSVVALEDTGRWYADADGEPAFAHGVVRIERAGAAKPDALPSGRTCDRAGFLAQIRDDVAETARGRRSMTLLVAAIDGLGRLNEEFGPDEADGIIREVAARMHAILRRRDRLVRYSGNRFALALVSCPFEQAEMAMSRLADLVAAEPLMTAQGPAFVRLRIGAAAAPEHAGDAPGLMRRAEEALAAAKHSRHGLCALYERALSREAPRRTGGTPALDVVEALNTRRIVFARQPVVEARCRTAAFAEALVRIRAADGRIVNAGDIIPAVERAGLVGLVDGRMLELTADYLAARPDERLAINVSPLTLRESEWLGTLAAHLGARPGIASRLIIELTEAAAMRDPQTTRARLDAMKALGVGVAIDHFGAGRASLQHLRSLPVDIVKIDGAFVQNLSRSSDDRFFVRALVDLAHHLNIATVAEWVGDEDTANMLAEWGFDFLQGDHCGAPALVDDESRAGSAAAVG